VNSRFALFQPVELRRSRAHGIRIAGGIGHPHGRRREPRVEFRNELKLLTDTVERGWIWYLLGSKLRRLRLARE